MPPDRLPAGGGDRIGSGFFDDLLRRIDALEQAAIKSVTGAHIDASGTLHIEGVPDTKKGYFIYNDGTGLVRLPAPTMDFLTAGRDPDDPADAMIVFNAATMLPEWRQTRETCSGA